MYGPIFMRMLPASVTRSLLAGLLLMAGGCALLKPAPTPILPPDELYSQGEKELGNRRYLEARESFRKIVERHPNSSWLRGRASSWARASTARRSSTRPSR